MYFSASLLGFNQTILGNFIHCLFLSFILSYSFFYLQENLLSVQIVNLPSQLSLLFPDALCSELGHMQFCSGTVVILYENHSSSTCFLCVFSLKTINRRCTKSKASFLSLATDFRMEHSCYFCQKLQNYCFEFPGSEEFKHKLKLQNPDMTHQSCIVFCGSEETGVKWCHNLSYCTNTVVNSREQTYFSCGSWKFWGLL